MTNTTTAVKMEDLDRIKAFLIENREEMLSDLLVLVNEETPSGDIDRLSRGRDAVRNLIRLRLGEPEHEVHKSGGNTAGDMFSIDFAGRGSGRNSPVALVGHYDTVWPAGTLAEIPAAVSGDLITGPGVFDMKAGLVQAVWAVHALAANEVPTPPVRFVINGDEETGSLASREFLEDACVDSQCALVFEASVDGRVKTARKGVGLFRVDVTGVEAHAGLDPRAGASAVHELARLVTEIANFADVGEGVDVNVGVVSGGTRTNVSAGRAYAEIDVRITNMAEARAVDERFAGLRVRDPRCELAVQGEWNRPTFERTPEVGSLFDFARETAAGLGFALEEASVGGASDGNFIALLGVPVLDGIGAVGAGAHARHEFATVSGLLERTALAAGVIAGHV